MTRFSLRGARQTQVQVLKDYLITQHERVEPLGVIALLENIGRCFPTNSVTARLVGHTTAEIRNQWHQGHLSRKLLILTAFPLLYESCIDLVACRRRLADIFDHHSASFVFPAPRSRA